MDRTRIALGVLAAGAVAVASGYWLLTQGPARSHHAAQSPLPAPSHRSTDPTSEPHYFDPSERATAAAHAAAPPASAAVASSPIAAPDVPPPPPAAAPAIDRAAPDPLTDAELAAKHQRGVVLIDLALARVVEQRRAATARGDDERAAALEVRQRRLEARKQQRLHDIEREQTPRSR